MLSNQAFHDLLFGGLDETWVAATRRWLDEFQARHGLGSDIEAVEWYSDTEIIPQLVDAGVIFQNKEVWRCELIGLPTPRFAIQLIPMEGVRLVAIHEGFTHLMGFLIEADLLKYILVERLTWLQPTQTELLQTRLRYATIRLAQRYLVEPFRLPSFAKEFPDDVQIKRRDELTSMLAFAVLHELAHQDLGHHVAPRSPVALSEPPHLLLEESRGFFKQQEFDADLRAILTVRSHHQSFFAGVALFLQQLAFLEMYATEQKLTHPMAVNRLSHLGEQLPESYPDKVRELARSIAQLMARQHEDQRASGLHLMLNQMSLAAPDDAFEEYHIVARSICQGGDIWQRYIGSGRKPDSNTIGRETHSISGAPPRLTGIRGRTLAVLDFFRARLGISS